ncbi:MAG: hypothetical protein A2W26_00870 [Acidobacteria bacterium RBG_16_64_8]|nr:MAG: hypothetical protein A2W26_00870 [Acidobacteria bacterium RBG_16_64_8]
MRRAFEETFGAEQGISLIETLTAIVLFVLLLLMIDSVFITAHRSTRTVELAADVDQNARIAIERLTREVREAAPAWVVTGGTPGAGAVVFKSARFSDSIAVFCLHLSQAEVTAGGGLYDPLGDGTGENCWTAPGPSAPPELVGTHLPKWQRYVGYYVVTTAGGGYELRRYTGNLTTSDEALPGNPTLPPAGSSVQVIATGLQSFDITLVGSRFSVVATRSESTEVVQGSPLPAQRIQLDATVLLQN